MPLIISALTDYEYCSYHDYASQRMSARKGQLTRKYVSVCMCGNESFVVKSISSS